jgi:hypothetical protein
MARRGASFWRDWATLWGEVMTGQGQEADAGGSVQAFDLNIEKVLEHWPIAFALREVIANALDEQAITGSSEPTIEQFAADSWRIRDYGRGLEYQHLTQKENPEKLNHPDVIGQFGSGLKDALAVCDRKRVAITIRSSHCDLTTELRPKAGFADIRTLHGIVAPPSDASMIGTEVDVVGVSDEDMSQAMSYFLRFSDDRVLEHTPIGDVLERGESDQPGRIYVKGLVVAEEPNFLFSYNITSLNAPLRRALNRERSNVGRTAYTDQVKKILKGCQSAYVAGLLARDLKAYLTGDVHDELLWKDVALHACRVLQSTSKVIFVTPWQTGIAPVTHAQDDGYEVVVVSDEIAAGLGSLTDLEGRPMFDVGAYVSEWNDSFVYKFVPVADLTPAEQKVFALAEGASRLAQVDLARMDVSVAISETTRLSAGSEVVGVWDSADRRIVVRRDQLVSPEHFLGTFLHELTHATSNFTDLTLEFEQALTQRLGTVAAGQSE